MRILLIDIDTLRPDHMGCYGYARQTTPCMDEIANDGVVFERYYTPNAPCLPSRAALCSGLYGIHNGVVGHGGTAADMRLQGESRSFRDDISENGLIATFRKAGYYTASISSFAERHSAWWFNAAFNECHNVGKGGMESAEEVTPIALKWLEDHADQDDWLLHYHIWDPHTPYRAPVEFGNPFEGEPLPDPWIDEAEFARHRDHVGPHGAREISMWTDDANPRYPRHPGSIETLAGAKDFIDQYDCGVRFADDNVAQLIAKLKAHGVYDDTAIIITSDHGENIGELGLYGEHATADEPCCHIPMIIRWPGMRSGRDAGFHQNIDLAPTVAQLLGVKPNAKWDGQSYAAALESGADCGRDHVIISQSAHVCQKSARWDRWLYVRTVHGGYHLFPDEMLFDINADPHETRDLAAERPDLCAIGARLILNFDYEMMKNSESDIDPMWTVMREGGPFHSRGAFDGYVQRLKATERGEHVEELMKRYPDEKY